MTVAEFSASAKMPVKTTISRRCSSTRRVGQHRSNYKSNDGVIYTFQLNHFDDHNIHSIIITMEESKKMHLTAFMRPVSLHTGAWRYPGAEASANFNLAHIKSFIRKLEDAKFDAFFMADHLAVLNMPLEALKRSHTTTSFEPFTLLSALAMVTDKIGLAATASTTYDEPYHIARRFASLDHLSNGRAAWVC